MSAFDLSEFNNINNLLKFKLNNPPQLYINYTNNVSYATFCLTKYYTDSKQPKLDGPDFVVIHYTYWFNEYGYEECKCNEDYFPGSIVVLGAEYDKDVQPNWHDAATYHKYDEDCDYDIDDDSEHDRW